jgi:EamA-like transporter family
VEGLAVSRRVAAEPAAEVPAQRGRAEAALPGHPLDRNAVVLQQGLGAQQPLGQQPGMRGGAGAGQELPGERPGDMLAFTAYGIAVRTLSTATVSTYAYVNPVVAVILGALILAEPVTPSILAGGSCIVVAVAVILRYRNSPAH